MQEWQAAVKSKFAKRGITDLLHPAIHEILLRPPIQQQQHYDRGASVEQHGVSDGGVGGVHDVQPSPQQQQQPSGVHHVQPLQQQQQQAQAQAPQQQQAEWRCDLGTVDELNDCFEVAGVPQDIHRSKVFADTRIMSENIFPVIIGV